MNRMWEIREHDGSKYSHRMGMRDFDKSPEEAYECGYEDGYEAAMEEMESKYSERRASYRMSRRRM